MTALNDFRQQYPQYNDMPDAALADAIYTKFYTDMPRSEFNAKLGLKEPGLGEHPGSLVIPLPGGKEVRPSLTAAVTSLFQGAQAPGKALQGDYNAEAPENPGWISETDIARQRMAATRMADDASKLSAGVMLAQAPGGIFGAPKGALASGPGLRAQATTQAAAQTEKITPQELIAAGAAGKEAAAVSGETFTPNSMLDYVTRARSALTKELLPDTVANQPHGILNAVEASAKRASTAGPGRTETVLSGPGFHIADDIKTAAPLTASDIIALRQAFTALQKTPGPNSAGAGIAKSVLDDWLAETAPSLAKQVEDFTGNFRAGFLGADVAAPANRAQLQAGATHSGMNIENKIRSAMATIVAKEEERAMRGHRQKFSPAIVNEMRGVAVPSGKESAARIAGNAMGGGGGIAAGGLGVAGILANPLIAAIPAVGYGIKTLANRNVLKKVDSIAQKVMADSPLGRSRAPTEAQIDEAVKAIVASKVSAQKKLAMLRALQNVLPRLLTGQSRENPPTAISR